MNEYLLANHFMWQQFGGAKKKWHTLSHNGVLFPPAYVKHNVPVIYNSVEIILDEASEEAATLYAKYTGSDYVKNSTFRKNFWKDWSKILPKSSPIKKLDLVDFSRIYEWLIDQKEKRKLLGKVTDTEQEKYKYAIVDGKSQPVGNFRIEPPGIFLGRGCNPNLGKIKRRIYPEDIIINIGSGESIPSPLEGHKWKSVIHDQTVEWLASWTDTITRKNKYVWLGAHSDMKGKNDMEKFDLARKLKTKIKKIREANNNAMTSDKYYDRQIATALYFIDNFALRVGNEKSEDEADTVGVTSLRVEHIKFKSDYHVELDFLGKDSVRYNRTVKVTPQVYDNLQEFVKNKKPTDDLFDLITPVDINKYLQNFMPKLTAKVFRTFNASNLFQEELDKIDELMSKTKSVDAETRTNAEIQMLLDLYVKANAKVAMLCNHQKNITKSTDDQIKKLTTSIKDTKAKIKKAKTSGAKPPRIKKMKETLKKLIAKRELKTELKNISLGTSKINYIDPRISVAFMNKHKIPIDKIFTKTLQEKFKWAMNVDPDYKF